MGHKVFSGNTAVAATGLLPVSQEARQFSQWHRLACCSTEAARSLLPYEQARAFPALPLGMYRDAAEELLSIAVASPVDSEVLRALRFATNRALIPEAVDEDVLRRAILLAYRGQGEEQEDVPALLSAIIQRALLLQASDIHIEPDVSGVLQLRYRVSGELRRDTVIQFEREDCRDVIRRIKILAALDTTRTTIPQQGALQFRDEAWDVRLRVSIVPQTFGEKAVLRVLHNFFFDSVEEGCPFRTAGLDSEQRDLLCSYLAAERGVLLLSGPTGSGKSTLLYCALQYLNDEKKSIVTMEDPVERLLPGVSQTEIDLRSEGFPGTLKAMLRQDPDVMMVGEIRDSEAAHTALSAGISGTLVLSTVHAGSCFEVLQRLRGFGVSADEMASALRLISSQRLLKKNCPLCLEILHPERRLAELFHLPPNARLARSKGCEQCAEHGSGRVAAFEFLPVTPAVSWALRSPLSEPQTLQRLTHAAREAGFRSLAFSIRRLLLTQAIAPETALGSLS